MLLKKSCDEYSIYQTQMEVLTMISLSHEEQGINQSTKGPDNNVEQTINILKQQVELAEGMSTIPTPEWREKTEEFIGELSAHLSKLIKSDKMSTHNVNTVKELQNKTRELKSFIIRVG